MDANNFVAPGNGGWIVYHNGQFQGTYGSQAEAEQLFNYLNGGPPLYATGQYYGRQNGSLGGNPAGAGSWNSTPVGGGSGYLPYAADLAGQVAQQQYLRDKLAQLDIPGLDLQRLMSMLGVTGYYLPGGGAGGAPANLTPESALDYIWKTRGDLADFYTSNGWDISSPEKQRAAVQNWLSISPEGKAAGGDPVRAAATMGGAGANGAEWAAANTAGALPTFAREQWNQANQQWQKQFNQGNKQFWNQFLGSMSGPRNWERYSKMLPQVFGAVTGQPSWEQAATNFARSGRNTPNAQQSANWWNPGPNAQNRAAFTQPTAMNWSDTQNMTPSQRAMEEGRWSYAGLDPNDMWAIGQRARPTGQANPYTQWGS